MGTVHPIRDQSHMALGAAVEAFLVTLDHPESRGTRRVYASTLRALRAEFGDATDTGTLEPRQVAAWFTRQWGQGAPATWNRNLDAIRSAQRYWQDQAVDDRHRPDLGPAPAPAGRRPFPRAVPRRRRAAAHPRGHRHPRAHPVAPAVRDRSTLRRGAPPRRRGPGPAQPQGQGAPQGRRRSTSSSGRPAPPGCCPGCSRAARPARCS